MHLNGLIFHYFMYQEAQNKGKRLNVKIITLFHIVREYWGPDLAGDCVAILMGKPT